MSLVAGDGPLSTERAGWFAPEITGALVYVEPHPRRVQAIRAQRCVIDTEEVLLVHRQGEPLSYAFREDAVRGLPYRALPEAPGFVQVAWDAVDTWFEEGRQLVHYPPNPYHRIDCRPTRRALRVEVAGMALVDTDDTVILFETALAPRLYVTANHVRTDLLQASTTSTYCNYKGYASYWSAVVGDTVIPDLAWAYLDPLPESAAISGLFSFDLSRAAGFAELPKPAGRLPL
ncbi:DUF427 domain-containing protein [Mycolicibacter hiberniae]|uniref:Uncharacterized protein n=1 Tax=Mycolicibacter hiberniae TaxID=29314 RepID=A0A7I7X6Y0_9MYCO|nr:DUF427 domain-containing protein [Mycolicibacter hiberniae]MCV7087505.1 DUF427 domain-containing protein [Mycolicibacter hiberniae]ORV69073.1 hypothetical protein AWC09_13945 [Mycolicibacter hiberniae]BBZ24975.1 hypothetical protein MHIB_33930 [Mycolicibacter hiberniae]